MEKTIALFASHFEVDYIPLYIKTYLIALKEAAGKVILIHTGKDLPELEHTWLQTNEISLIERENIGYDFGSWKDALDKQELLDFEHFIFANDSCICIQPIQPIIQWFRMSDASFAGLINSNERKAHVQSFFMMMDKNGIDIFLKAFDKYGTPKDKNKLINTYEVGLTQLQNKAGNKAQTYLQIPASNKNNPMFHQTLKLIKTGFPLVKKQLVFNTLAPHDIDSMRSAGIYTGPKIIKDAINENSTLDVDWNKVFN